MKHVSVRRMDLVLGPDPRRVLLRPLDPSDERQAMAIVARAMMLPEEQVKSVVKGIMKDFAQRHRALEQHLLGRFEEVRRFMVTDQPISDHRKILIGAYFSKEYSFQSTALFNPSIVPHPDQTGVERGGLRLILSLRATGEGHISSIAFRTGTIHADGRLSIDPPSPYSGAGEPNPDPSYDKTLFERKLYETGLGNEYSSRIMAMLGPSFTYEELDARIRYSKRRVGGRDDECVATMKAMAALALSNYTLRFDGEETLPERIIFPASPTQSNGIEDARFVLFRANDGTTLYHAIYTAYDGDLVLPQLLTTTDFQHFKFSTLNGPAVQNKGMSLFPRKINGRYAMLSRQDNENIFLMYSDNICFWYSSRVILRPTFPWESVQLGNCGSPIEIDEGWLVLSHGVGPMRRYSIGAFLLDKNDPSCVIGRLASPLITAGAHERDGYVPNVVYTCGAIVHNQTLFIPYARADYSTGFALVGLREVIDAME